LASSGVREAFSAWTAAISSAAGSASGVIGSGGCWALPGAAALVTIPATVPTSSASTSTAAPARRRAVVDVGRGVDVWGEVRRIFVFPANAMGRWAQPLSAVDLPLLVVVSPLQLVTAATDDTTAHPTGVHGAPGRRGRAGTVQAVDDVPAARRELDQRPLPGGGANADRWRALVTATAPDGARLVVVDPAALAVVPGSWTPMGMEATRSDTLVFDDVAVDVDGAVSGPGADVERPGFATYLAAL
jgi:hypothetical protein